MPQAGEILLVSGWGGTSFTLQYSPVLKSVNLTVISNDNCISLLRKTHLGLPYTAFCAGEKKCLCYV